jgi:hypothetical protein
LPGYRRTHPALIYTELSPQPWIPFRARFFSTAVILLTLGLDIALVYGAYRLLALIF